MQGDRAERVEEERQGGGAVKRKGGAVERCRGEAGKGERCRGELQRRGSGGEMQRRGWRRRGKSLLINTMMWEETWTSGEKDSLI